MKHAARSLWFAEIFQGGVRIFSEGVIGRKWSLEEPAQDRAWFFSR